ncbi:MAG: 2OG-Fe(II) oxygenase [Acidobacteriota bacterium]
MKEALVNYIVERLERDADVLRAEFNRDRGIPARFATIDDLFPVDVAHRIRNSFPPLDKMRLLSSFREQKYTSKSLDKFSPTISDATFAFQDERVVNAVSKITGQRDLVGDLMLYAGGISAMAKDHFLNPHIDNSHDFEQKNYRVLNLLYYCSPGWTTERGGNFELWDEKVTKPLEIPSFFNRLVLMETNARSWHSVNKVQVDDLRCCVSNYYFSPHSPNGYDISHVTFFKGRPEQKLNRFVAAADGLLRTAVRKVAHRGLSKKDLFEGDIPK